MACRKGEKINCYLVLVIGVHCWLAALLLEGDAKSKAPQFRHNFANTANDFITVDEMTVLLTVGCTLSLFLFPVVERACLFERSVIGI